MVTVNGNECSHNMKAIAQWVLIKMNDIITFLQLDFVNDVRWVISLVNHSIFLSECIINIRHSSTLISLYNHWTTLDYTVRTEYHQYA